MRVLAIGERFNGPEWVPEDPYDFKLRIQAGVYNYGSRRDFLRRVGVSWTHGMNLLWPHPVPCQWDAIEARITAEALRSKVEEYDRVLLFGERICDAFDVPFKVGMVFGVYVPLPHPVGNTKLWDKNFIRSVLE